MSTPANATEAPTFAKVWQQVKGNAPTFAMIWGLILITALIDLVVSVLLYFVSFTSLYSFYSLLEDNIGGWSALQIEFIANSISTIGSLPTTVLRKRWKTPYAPVPAS